MAVDLDRIVVALDRLFDLNAAEPNPAMSRHLPRVHEEAGIDWKPVLISFPRPVGE
jgi:hypothetical protein